MVSSGHNFNVFPGSSGTLGAYMVDEMTKNYLTTIAKAYEKNRPSEITEIVAKRYNEIEFVDIPDYILPGFILKDFTPVVNLGVLNVRDITEYNPNDIFSMMVYSVSMSIYMGNNVFSLGIEDIIGAFYMAVFMKMHGKKSGLMSSYKELIPSLRFLISLYVRAGILQERVDEPYMKKLSSSYLIDHKQLKTDYDFTKIESFLESVRDNRIISISKNKFSNSIVNVGNVVSLPMFEDISRFFATILAGKISGNRLFSTYWYKFSKEITERVLFHGVRLAKKGR